MRIVIAEDSALLRAGIERILIDAGHEVVAGVSDATDLLRIVNELRPDLAILDVRMPPTFTDEGILAAALLRSQNPESPVLVLSHYVEERYASDLIASDTRGFGYLLKDRVADVPSFLDTVEVVGGGGTADPSRTRSAPTDGGGPGQLRHCGLAPRLGGLGREAHRLDLHEVEPDPRRE
jgi:DNA-binding NarL/FixJ family response regulator